MIDASVLGSAEAFLIMLRMSLEAINISGDMKASMFAHGFHQLSIDSHLSFFLEQRTASIRLSYHYLQHKGTTICRTIGSSM